MVSEQKFMIVSYGSTMPCQLSALAEHIRPTADRHIMSDNSAPYHGPAFPVFLKKRAIR